MWSTSGAALLLVAAAAGVPRAKHNDVPRQALKKVPLVFWFEGYCYVKKHLVNQHASEDIYYSSRYRNQGIRNIPVSCRYLTHG